MPKPTQLAVTNLEERTVPAIFGVTWPDPSNLTVSFAPDGTDVGGTPSALDTMLDAQIGNDLWQNEIRRAFQTWAAVTNINVRVVGDNGAAFGSVGQLQANWKQGDVRIAARPLSPSTLAIANPPDLVSGWAGEIVLNSNFKFSVGGSNGTYDLYSVMLHEIGHSLGLSSNFALDPSAVMYEDYVGVRSGLSSADIAAIQELYSPRTSDVYEGRNGNNTTRNATTVTYLSSFSQLNESNTSGTSTPTLVRADITRSTDVDVYRIAIPTDTSSPVLSLSTSQTSQLAARVSVLDSRGVVVLSAMASAPGADLWLDLKSLPRGQTYFVRVEAARSDAFGVGEYRLAVGNWLTVAVGGTFSTIFSTGGETLETNNRVNGVSFNNVQDNADSRWDAVGRSSFKSATDSHTINFTAKDAANALVVAVWTAGDVSPNLQIRDRNGNPVAFQVLRADGYASVIQILNVPRGMTYQFTLTSTNWRTPTWLGDVGYRFAADLRETPISLTTFASGTLTATASTAARNLVVTQSQLYRFELSAASVLPQPDASVTLTIADSTGKIVFRLTATPGQTIASDVFLTPGTYTVRLTATTTKGSLLPLSILGRFTPLTDPIGPMLVNPTAPAPTAVTTPTSSTTTVPTSTTSSRTAPATTTATTTTTRPTTSGSSYVWGTSLLDPLRIFP